jgi:photosystem II stability/assembly factor-like uncharacterized protein
MKLSYHLLFLGMSVFTCSCFDTAVQINLTGPNFASGGRAIAVTVDPRDYNHVLVATPTGGLYESPDGGNLWARVNAMPEFGCYDIKFCPSNGNILVATCIEDTKTINRGGIWLSKDAGKSWTQPPSSKPRIFKSLPRRYSAYGIAFGTDGRTIAVGTDSGIAVSKDFGDTWKYLNPLANNLPNRFYSVLVL